MSEERGVTTWPQKALEGNGRRTGSVTYTCLPKNKKAQDM